MPRDDAGGGGTAGTTRLTGGRQGGRGTEAAGGATGAGIARPDMAGQPGDVRGGGRNTLPNSGAGRITNPGERP